MADFTVNPKQLKKIADIGIQLGSTISHCADDINQISNDIRSVGSSFEIVSSRLQKQSGTIQELSKLTQSYFRTLMQASTLYENAERAASTFAVSKTDTTQIQGMNGNNGNTNSDASDNIWGKDNTYTYKDIEFHKGDPKRPKWEANEEYDNFYPYDPNEKPTIKDHASWGLWSLAPAYELFKYVPDGMKAYEHYRGGSGDPLHIDYEKAYKEDKVIHDSVDAYVDETNAAIQEMIAKGEKPPFSITSELLPISQNPSTENWQKTIGRHYVWISSTVTQNEDGTYHVSTTVHELDRYNFNKGDADIKTGIKDADNGRFETLGWAKSFDTYGEVKFETDISGDSVPGNNPDDSTGRSGPRFGADSDRRVYREDRRSDARR